jgi:pyruvate/2-oxoglutarate dehydrogenase complex dihydrolipoamide acyltransferase (E2) component
MRDYNPPRTAILTVGATQPKPVVGEEGWVVVRLVMRVTLSGDYSIVDGAIAVRFLTDLTLLLW